MARTTPSRLLFVLRITTVISFLFLADPSFSQFSDDFSDGNITTDPPWMGDTADFIVSSSNAFPTGMQPGLQLSGQGSDSSALVVASSQVTTTEWGFWIKLSFNTSVNNFVRVYLASDQADLKAPLNGYFLQLGGATDSLVLYRQHGEALEPLLTGQHAYTGQSTNQMRIKVRHDEAGMWALFADQAGGYNFLHEGSCYDETLTTTTYFGLYCQYTSSNASRVYFDEVYASELVVDTLPPQLLGYEWLSPMTLHIDFSEPLDPLTALDTSNYFLDPGVGHPQEVLFSGSQQSVELTFAQTVEAGTSYSLFIQNLTDLAGNAAGMLDLEVLYSLPQSIKAWDLLINEVMADVNPAPAGLPAVEYIELFNPGTGVLSTGGLLIRTAPNASPLPLPEHMLDSGAFLILTDDEVAAELSAFGTVIGLPGLNLLREGTIQLSDQWGRVIHQLDYDVSLYADADKEGGGWSLEQVDPWHPCSGPGNWIATKAIAGGTPGAMNTVDAPNELPLAIEGVFVVADTLLEVVLNTSMGAGSPVPTDFEVLPHGGHPQQLTPLDSTYRCYALSFDDVFQAGLLYTLNLLNPLASCSGELLEAPPPFIFGIPESPVANDVVINELLFNPVGDGVDFVEVYNRSQKVIDLQQLMLGRVEVDFFGFADTVLKDVAERKELLLPGEYLVLTTDPQDVLATYFHHDEERFWKVKSMPAYNNDSGVVVLFARGGEGLDHFKYDAGMHHPLLVSPDGVSLERIDFDRSSADPTNWHSASSASGYATPGLQNSQFSDEPSEQGFITVEPELFSPDNDGFEDVTHIRYQLAAAGYVASIVIFDAAGRPVRLLLNNQLLGVAGTVSWDGLMDDRNKAPVGLYVILFHAFEPGGKVVKVKKVVVVGG